jgi:homoserine O-acetyltransferase
VLAINSADDERNPPESGIMERELKRIRNARLLLVPGSEATAGHGTTASAKWYAKELQEFLNATPKRSM